MKDSYCSPVDGTLEKVGGRSYKVVGVTIKWPEFSVSLFGISGRKNTDMSLCPC